MTAVCEYCGCQQIDVVAELTAEHDRLRELGHDLAAAARAADPVAARPLAEAMRTVLGPHTHVEERGLFPALGTDFAAPLEVLVQEHRRIDAVLEEVAGPAPAAGWPERTQVALTDLFEHILKEQDGVFPAALATLGTADWEAVTAARADAHTGPAAAVGARP